MKKILTLLSIVLFNGFTNGQNLMLDTTFNSADTGFDYGAGIPNGYFYPFSVRCTIEQPDGKIIIGGNYNTYNNATLFNKPIRLNSDGTIDSSFNLNSSYISTMEIKAMALQGDGKIIFVGNFAFTHSADYYNGSIFRLNSDGSFDTGFNPNFPYQSINDVAVQPDGKIILGGKFTSSGSTTTNCIARINNDGTLDTTFNPGGVGALFGYQDGYNYVTNVSKIKLLSDGKIMIIGNFGAYNGVARRNIARLNADGTLDLTFNPGTGFDELGTTSYPPTLITMTLQPDGKLLVGGKFVGYNGLGRRGIVRINTDGSADASFQTGLGASYTFQGASGPTYDYPAMVRAIVVQANGKIVLGGYFERFNGINKKNIARLNSDGTLDATFNSGQGVHHASYGPQNNLESAGVFSFTALAGQKILISGQFMSYDNTMAKCLARIYPDGNMDLSFNAITSFDGSVNCSVVQPDGKILVGGSFTKYYTNNKRGLVRLNTDGTLDSSFAIGSGIYTTNNVFDLSVRSIAIQPDNKIIVAGYFNYFNGVAKNSIVRLNADGSIDTGFNLAPAIASQMFYEGINKIVIQPDGKILIVVDWEKKMFRLNSDGSLDSAFAELYYMSNVVFLQPDGKILFAETYSTPNDRLKRLNANGTLDTSFPTLNFTGNSNRIYSIDVQSDGKIIVAGSFSNVGTSGVPKIVRLNADGTLDVSFYLTGTNAALVGKVTAVKVMPNGKILIAGNQAYSNNLTFLYTLNSAGTIETSFSDSQIGSLESLSSTAINDINIQDSENIYIGGSFTSFGTDGRNRFARLTESALGLDHFNNSQVKIYPNPTNGILNIDLPEDLTLDRVEVYNNLGQIVISQKGVTGNKILDVSNLRSGIYYLKINADEKQITRKFIKE